MSRRDTEAAAERRRDTAMLAWLRRQVNGDLRYWRHAGGERAADVAADCKAKREMLTWAENWNDRDWSQDYPPQVASVMAIERLLVIGAMRRVARGYRHRPGWKPEWDLEGYR